MWQSFSKNTKLIIITIFVIITIILFTIFRDSSQMIDKNKAMDIINNNLVTKAYVVEPYVYLYTPTKSYKVPKEAIDMDKLFATSIVEYSDDSSEIMVYFYYFL